MFLVGVISESGLKNSMLFSLQSTKCVVHYVYFVNFLREKTFLSHFWEKIWKLSLDHLHPFMFLHYDQLQINNFQPFAILFILGPTIPKQLVFYILSRVALPCNIILLCTNKIHLVVTYASFLMMTFVIFKFILFIGTCIKKMLRKLVRVSIFRKLNIFGQLAY